MSSKEVVRTRQAVVAPNIAPKKVVPVVKKTVASPVLPEAKKVVPVVKSTASAEPSKVLVKPVKVPAEKKIKEPKADKVPGATSYVISLLIQHKYSDEEILKMTQAQYPDRNEHQIKVYISCQRGDINSGRKAKWLTVAGKPIERLYKNEKGEIIQKPVTEKKARVTKKEKPLLASILTESDDEVSQADDPDRLPETSPSK